MIIYTPKKFITSTGQKNTYINEISSGKISSEVNFKTIERADKPKVLNFNFSKYLRDLFLNRMKLFFEFEEKNMVTEKEKI